MRPARREPLGGGRLCLAREAGTIKATVVSDGADGLLRLSAFRPAACTT
jgi:hypothetical protein